MSEHIPFNLDGPTQISEEDFANYRKLCTTNRPDFDVEFHAWICQRHKPGARRACLRNMLRQPVTSQSPDLHNYRNLRNPPMHIFKANASDEARGQETLYWILYNQPNLLTEITQEFLYNLQHHYYTAQHQSFNTTMIEFLLTLPSTRNIGHLAIWKHHPNFTIDCNAPSTWVKKYLTLCSTPNFSARISNLLWESIEIALDSDHYDIDTYATEHPDEYYAFHSDREHISHNIHEIASWLNQSCSSPANLSVIKKLITAFEAKLHATYFYLDLDNLIQIIPKLPINLAIQLASRHVIAYYYSDKTLINNVSRRDLEWLRGFCAQYLSDDNNVQQASSGILSIYLDKHPLV